MNIRSGYHQINEHEGKIKKGVTRKNMKTSWNQTLQLKWNQMIKYLGSLPCEILRTLPKIDKEGIQTYGQ